MAQRCKVPVRLCPSIEAPVKFHPLTLRIVQRMHPVLRIQEVLLNIFGHIVPSGLSDERHKCANSDLAALVRTCRAFKEPALDILWSDLDSPAPLVRCLPEVSHRIVTEKGAFKTIYSFTRPLERAEWELLCSYAHRVWRLRDFEMGLDWKTVRTSLDFTPDGPLFPNLRQLHCEFAQETIPLLHLPLPSLIRLNLRLFSKIDLRMLQDPLGSLVKASPNIKRLDVWGFPRRFLSTKIVSECVHGWSNLQVLVCPEVPLDVDAFTHLSRMPALTQLEFTPGATFSNQIIPSESLTFSNLNLLRLHARTLAPVSRLLSWARLPAVTEFTVAIDNCPPKQDLVSFIANMQIAGMDQTIQELELNQMHDAPDTIPPRTPDAPLLVVDDLRPCVAFHNLRRINLNVQWDVDLSDADLLTLASAWPRLEELLINVKWGWNRPGGMTPGGLATLLQTCPSLTLIALAIDTRGYTQGPTRRPRQPLDAPISSIGRAFHIDVLDSVLEQDSVHAMVTFFTSVVPHFQFKLTAWETWSVLEHPDQEVYGDRWSHVGRQVEGAVQNRWAGALRELFFRSK